MTPVYYIKTSESQEKMGHAARQQTKTHNVFHQSVIEAVHRESFGMEKYFYIQMFYFFNHFPQ